MTVFKAVLAIGCALILLAAFGVALPVVDIFKLGVAVAFAAWLVA